MKLQSSMFRNLLFILALILALPAFRVAAQTTPDSTAAAQAAVPARITQAIDETQLVRLKGNVHPLARPEFDQGPVSSELPMQRMLLVLKRSVEQESALAQLMVDQQNATSQNYHKWLTPEQFGTQFGPSDVDIQTAVTWLESHGFQVAKVTKGKIAVEFSGNAAQVKEAFRTEIHKYNVNGEVHLANASDPQIPAALSPVVHGLAPLNNFRAKPAHRVAGEFTKPIGSTEAKSVNPEFTTSGGFFAIGPTDFATIYNVLPLWNATPTPVDGTGKSIAVIGVSNINPQDVQDFRTLLALPTGGAANTPVVVIDGSDPGIINTGAETEALLDVEWSGAVAKGAQIHLVIAADTDIASGLLLAIFNVIDNNSDPILSLSFGDCEPNEGANNTGLWQILWEQAAAQGITVTVASGDPGSAGCEDQNAPPPNPATTGLQVNAFASTPFNIAVGGTDFNDAGTQTTYFKPNSQNDPNTLASAISYIPESTWNESCTNASFNAITGLTTPEANCNSTNVTAKAAVITVGGGGGPSHCFTISGTTCSGGYAKPAYQMFSGLTGMPSDGHRDTPDVSLFASSGFNKSFYVVCEADAVSSPSCQKGQAFHFLGVGGTSASTPSFAGIMALVNQKFGRQGNANFAIYKLAQMQYAAATACNSIASPLPSANCTFNDVTAGTIAMPCTKGSLNCTTSVSTDSIGVLSGYNATAGYDLSTGLGSVNASNLVNNWSTALAAFTSTTTTLSISPLTGITAGQNVTVNVTVTPGSGTAKPSGDVALVSTATTGDGVTGFTLDSTGKVVNGTTNQLTGGTYSVTARYGGDGTFTPSVSPPVTVTVGKAASNTVGSVLVSVGGGNFATFTSGPAPVTLFLQASINPTGVLLPTGTVNFVDTFNGTPTTVASNVPVNSASEAFTLPGISSFVAGNHSIVANYSGDASFNASTSAPVTFTLTTTGTFTVSGTAATVTAGSSGTSTITVTPAGGFTGIVNVTCPTPPPGVTCSPNPLVVNIVSASPVSPQLTVAVAAPSSSLTAMNLSEPQTFRAANLPSAPVGRSGWWTLSGGTGFATIFLLFLPGGRKRRRAALGLGLVCVLSFTIGCGGGYGGSGGGTSATTTKLTVSGTKVAATGSITVSATVTSTGRAPGGSVQFFVDGAAAGSTFPLTSGSTGNLTVTSANLPPLFQLIGTHSLSAHYLGDAYTLASASGTLNIAVTGTTQLTITGTSGSTTASGNVSLTIN